jgi:ribonuclease P protein subunit POP4
MPLTPETLPRHELVGLRVRVVESTDPSRVGIAGRVVGETMHTLCIDCDSGHPAIDSDAGYPDIDSDAASSVDGAGRTGVKQVPKQGTTFEFAIDEAADDREASGIASEPDRSGGPAGEGVTYVTVDGVVLLSRPARRTENGVDTIWR